MSKSSTRKPTSTKKTAEKPAEKVEGVAASLGDQPPGEEAIEPPSPSQQSVIVDAPADLRDAMKGPSSADLNPAFYPRA